jgi:hypothetical protein
MGISGTSFSDLNMISPTFFFCFIAVLSLVVYHIDIKAIIKNGANHDYYYLLYQNTVNFWDRVLCPHNSDGS